MGHLVAQHPGAIKIGRVGWFAKGVVYLIAGLLALSVAIKASGWTDASSTNEGQEASPLGAIKTVAQTFGGTLLLWLLAVGLLVYAAWRLVTATLPGHVSGKALAHRIGYVASAVMYITFAINAIVLALDSSNSPNGNEDVSEISHWFLTHRLGRVIIGLAGVIVICVGAYRVSKGATMDVEGELDLSDVPPVRNTWADWLGAVGEVGRGIGFGLVGFFLLRSAVTYDAKQATGLDGALRRLAAESWGVVVVVVVGVGFAAYGIFCLVTFTHRELEAP